MRTGGPRTKRIVRGKMAKSNGLDEWACAPPKRRKPCQTCGYGPEVVKAIRRVLELIAEGKSERSFAELRDWLHAEMGYDLGSGGLQKHIRECEPELRERVRQARGR